MRLFLTAGLAVVLAAGCGSPGRASSTGPVTPPAAVTTTPTTVSPTTAPPTSAPPTIGHPVPTFTPTAPTTVTRSSPVQLTAADAGATIAVRVGATVDLTLETPDAQWRGVNVSPSGLLTELPAPAPPPAGVRARWTVNRAGTVRVTATATANCPPPMACPMWARLFEVTLVIA